MALRIVGTDTPTPQANLRKLQDINIGDTTSQSFDAASRATQQISEIQQQTVEIQKQAATQEAVSNQRRFGSFVEMVDTLSKVTDRAFEIDERFKKKRDANLNAELQKEIDEFMITAERTVLDEANQFGTSQVRQNLTEIANSEQFKKLGSRYKDTVLSNSFRALGSLDARQAAEARKTREELNKTQQGIEDAKFLRAQSDILHRLQVTTDPEERASLSSQYETALGSAYAEAPKNGKRYLYILQSQMKLQGALGQAVSGGIQVQTERDDMFQRYQTAAENQKEIEVAYDSGQITAFEYQERSRENAIINRIANPSTLPSSQKSLQEQTSRLGLRASAQQAATTIAAADPNSTVKASSVEDSAVTVGAIKRMTEDPTGWKRAGSKAPPGSLDKAIHARSIAISNLQEQRERILKASQESQSTVVKATGEVRELEAERNKALEFSQTAADEETKKKWAERAQSLEVQISGKQQKLNDLPRLDNSQLKAIEKQANQLGITFESGSPKLLEATKTQGEAVWLNIEEGKTNFNQAESEGDNSLPSKTTIKLPSVSGRGITLTASPFTQSDGKNQVITSPMGPRGGRMHNGIDLAPSGGNPNPPIISPGQGKVIYASMGYNGGYGGLVEVEMPDGNIVKYAHLDSINVSQGDKLAPGMQLGIMGDTGRSFGTHLHLEVRDSKGRAIDPTSYFQGHPQKQQGAYRMANAGLGPNPSGGTSYTASNGTRTVSMFRYPKDIEAMTAVDEPPEGAMLTGNGSYFYKGRMYWPAGMARKISSYAGKSAAGFSYGTPGNSDPTSDNIGANTAVGGSSSAKSPVYGNGAISTKLPDYGKVVENNPAATYGYSALDNDSEARKALSEISTKLGIPATWLADIMAHETGNTFDTGITNSEGAIGLIQFYPGSGLTEIALNMYGEQARGGAMDHQAAAALRNMTVAEQLRGPVYYYLNSLAKRDGIKLDSLETTAAYIFMGAGGARMNAEERRRRYGSEWTTGYLDKLGKRAGRLYAHDEATGLRGERLHMNPVRGCAICSSMEESGSFQLHRMF